jgi:hypothetical protein
MAKAIYFDMDGTIADLYNYPDWLDCLNNSDVAPYVNAQPMTNMENLNALMEKFIAAGFIIGVISWAAMNGSNRVVPTIGGDTLNT